MNIWLRKKSDHEKKTDNMEEGGVENERVEERIKREEESY